MDLVNAFNSRQKPPSKKARLGPNARGAVSAVRALPPSVLYGDRVEWWLRPDDREAIKVSARVGDLLHHEVFPGTFKLAKGHKSAGEDVCGHLDVTDTWKGTEHLRSNCSHYYPAASASALGFAPVKPTAEVTASAKAEVGKWIFSGGNKPTDGQRIADFAKEKGGADTVVVEGDTVVVEGLVAHLQDASATGLMGPALAAQNSLAATGLSAQMEGLSAPIEGIRDDMTHDELKPSEPEAASTTPFRR